MQNSQIYFYKRPVNFKNTPTITRSQLFILPPSDEFDVDVQPQHKLPVN